MVQIRQRVPMFEEGIRKESGVLFRLSAKTLASSLVVKPRGSKPFVLAASNTSHKAKLFPMAALAQGGIWGRETTVAGRLLCQTVARPPPSVGRSSSSPVHTSHRCTYMCACTRACLHGCGYAPMRAQASANERTMHVCGHVSPDR